ncbi:SsgA family sporulation/cell division regulator [Streptomyces sp. SDT5-1]|uniref:SsgA family sporulation/cell division regulator n=1 Tax=Streptomyces sp. SDT5-1 TaxID=3406418 RepID=UPI003FD2A5E7
MHVTLELVTGARLVTTHHEAPVAVTLFHSSSDPLAVQLRFPEHISADGEAATWTFARSLLAAGLSSGARGGAVQITPRGPDHTRVELSSPQGVARLRFDTRALHRFLARSHTIVAPTEEVVAAELDHNLGTLFGSAA